MRIFRNKIFQICTKKTILSISLYLNKNRYFDNDNFDFRKIQQVNKPLNIKETITKKNLLKKRLHHCPKITIGEGFCVACVFGQMISIGKNEFLKFCCCFAISKFHKVDLERWWKNFKISSAQKRLQRCSLWTFWKS